MSSLATLENPDIAKVHDFWFTRPVSEWFMPPKGFDAECRDGFSHLVRDARDSKLDRWEETKEGSLALLVLLDQFTRNVFRDTPDAFKSDGKALGIATRSIARGFDKEVTIDQALTYYLPLMHNESLLAQIACLSLAEQLLARCTTEKDRHNVETGPIQSAKQHLAIIQKFGRYPSRNKILGRESTEEEIEYLGKNPSGFSNAPETDATAATAKKEL